MLGAVVELIVFYLICVVIVGVIANSRGRSGAGWALLALIISPLLAGLLVLVLGSTQGRGYVSLSDAANDAELRREYGHLVRSYKPAFSNSVVHEVDTHTGRRRFASEAEALGFAVAYRRERQRLEDTALTATPLIAAPSDPSPRIGTHMRSGPTSSDSYKGISYSQDDSGTVVAHLQGTPHTWTSAEHFRRWVDRQ